MYISLGVLWFFPVCIILGNACIQTLVVHLFLNLMKADGVYVAPCFMNVKIFHIT